MQRIVLYLIIAALLMLAFYVSVAHAEGNNIPESNFVYLPYVGGNTDLAAAFPTATPYVCAAYDGCNPEDLYPLVTPVP